MSRARLQLHHGSRIAIIGGGPAGAFFANFAAQLARERGIEVGITIFDGKDFNRLGPPGCNMCAGVISRNLAEMLRSQGIRLDSSRIQREIRGYYFQTGMQGFPLDYPCGGDPIITVFRGNGPRFSTSGGHVSFDDLLLQHAQQQRAEVIHRPVRRIALPEDPGEPVELFCEGAQGDGAFRADLVVGAFGLNHAMMQATQELGFGYRPPRTLHTYQVEIPLEPEYITERFRDTIFVYRIQSIERVRFAVIIPKHRHITVSIIGKGDACREDFERFIAEPVVARMFPEGWKLPACCCCRPRIAVTAARRPFADRLVIIGDAGFSRHYKNGIESAFITARLAAEAAFRVGIDADAFRAGYVKPARRIIIRDNRYGRFLLGLFDVISEHSVLSKVFLQVAISETEQGTTGLLRHITWNTFTGHVPYREIVKDFLQFRLQLRMARATVRTLLGRDASQRSGGRRPPEQNGSAPGLGPLRSGQTVAIVGGGPAGVGCAVALRNIAESRGIELKVILYEGKAYEGVPRYNQCVGVLSPPIERILSEELKIPFPGHLVQRTIRGYVLHTDNTSIQLREPHEPSLAVRRINFDTYLLEEAKKRGIDIVHSRITDLEFSSRGVMVYSESDNVRADAVVGAFGLDDGTTRIFERATPYRQPRYLNSIVTKIHPGMAFMNGFGDDIHAFLPSSLSGIEFGAVTPKMNHLTINIAGAAVNATSMDAFLDYAPVKALLPRGFRGGGSGLHYFKGKFPISVAGSMYGDRYLVIGDAAGLVRPYKGKGVNSGFLSGLRAARAMMDYGISREALDAFRQLNSDIIGDLPYGRVLRLLVRFGTRHGLLDAVVARSAQDAGLRAALFNCVSGHKSFKTIWDETGWRSFLSAIRSGARAAR